MPSNGPQTITPDVVLLPQNTVGNGYVVGADGTVLVQGSGVKTITLPAPTPKRRVFVKDASGNSSTDPVVVSTPSGTIDGSGTFTIEDDWGSALFEANATDWFVISTYGGGGSGPLVTATPAFSPAAGNFSSPFALTMTCSTPGSAIYYTDDGSTPTILSNLYSAPIAVGAATVTYKAIGVTPGYTNSAVRTGVYTYVPLFSVYWGYSSSTVLDEAGVLALGNTASEADAYRDYAFGSGSTVADYFFFWWPSSFAAPAAGNGFYDTIGAFPMTMAETAEGFPDGPVNGWYYLNLTVGGVPGRLWRTFNPFGGGGAQLIRVQ